MTFLDSFSQTEKTLLLAARKEYQEITAADLKSSVSNPLAANSAGTLLSDLFAIEEGVELVSNSSAPICWAKNVSHPRSSSIERSRLTGRVSSPAKNAE